MARFNYSKREKRWKIYHRLEAKQKRRFLRKMSEEDGFKMLKELHRFAYKLGPKLRLDEIDMAKIKSLAHIHSMFGKVKI